jgi:hypothetical protein
LQIRIPVQSKIGNPKTKIRAEKKDFSPKIHPENGTVMLIPRAREKHLWFISISGLIRDLSEILRFAQNDTTIWLGTQHGRCFAVKN